MLEIKAQAAAEQPLCILNKTKQQQLFYDGCSSIPMYERNRFV